MKIIDLITNYNKGEQLPKKIKINGIEFTNDGLLAYKRQAFDKEEYLFTDDYDWSAWLNDEIEIIEEDKKINKIRIDYNSVNIDKAFEKGTTTFFREKDIEIFQCLSAKINELIDEVNKLKDESR